MLVVVCVCVFVEVVEVMVLPREAEVVVVVVFEVFVPPPPPAHVVGTAEGWPAVFHVAVVGYGVAATVGEADAYGEGPGTSSIGVRCGYLTRSQYTGHNTYWRRY